MPDRLYAAYPEVYDAIQSEWDYDRDVSFVRDAFERRGDGGDRVLEVGCGTGEHTRRLAAAGFDVTAIDPEPAMLDRAREKCDADVRRGALPDPGIDGRFDLVVALRGVLNHLPAEDLAPALRALESRLAESGVLVFDNSPLPPEGNHPALDVGETEYGDYARIAQMKPRGDGRLDWVSIVLLGDGDWFADSRPVTPFDDGTIREALAELGLDVETHEGFGPGDERGVFVATA